MFFNSPDEMWGRQVFIILEFLKNENSILSIEIKQHSTEFALLIFV